MAEAPMQEHIGNHLMGLEKIRTEIVQSEKVYP